MSAGDRSPQSVTGVGFCLLPSELLQDILLRLSLPELLRLRSVSRFLSSLVSSPDFRQLYSLRSPSDTWLFLYHKRPLPHSSLSGFNDLAGRWFHFPVAGILLPSVFPAEDLYFLTASSHFFLFASNSRRQLLAVNLASSSVHFIPSSPLGPRGTSSWRRSSLRLIAGSPGSDHFLFLFADLHDSRPVLFLYSSVTDSWRSFVALEFDDDSDTRKLTRVKRDPALHHSSTEDKDTNDEEERVFLSVMHRRRESVILSAVVSDSGTSQIRPVFFPCSYYYYYYYY